MSGKEEMLQFVLNIYSRRWSCGVFDASSTRMSKCRYGLMVIFTLWTGLAEGQTVKGQIETVGDTVHLEFSGLSQWDYTLNRPDPNKIEMYVPSFDSPTEVSLKGFENSFFKKVEVDRNAPNGQVKIVFHLQDAKVESFDYLTDEPSRLIVDIYKQVAKAPEKPVAAAESSKAEMPTEKSEGKPTKTYQGDYKKIDKKTGRKVASDEILVVDPKGTKPAEETADKSVDIRYQQGVFDGADPSFKRFAIKDYEVKEEAIIASKQNIYLQFPMLKMPVSKFEGLLSNKPEYEIKDNGEKENKEAQLLLNLYQKNWNEKKKDRRFLFLKTYQYFISQYPKSQYDEIVRNMAAEIYLDLWKTSGDNSYYAKARDLYELLIQKYPDSPVTDRNRLILAYGDLERKDGALTLQRFQEYLGHNPNKEEVDQANKALAEGYLILNKYDDALKVYQDMEAQAKFKDVAAEASFRQGDVYFSQKKYADAIKSYQQSIKKYPGQEKTYPNGFFNMAEAQFWTGDYKEALKNYIEYLKAFPSGNYGGFAMARVGETLEILGADNSRAMGAYLECVFRFQDSPGAQVARVRMLSQKMKGMKEKEMKKAMEEMDHIRDTVKLPKVEEFITLMKADGFKRRGEDQKALMELIGYYQENPTTADANFFKKQIRGLLSSLLNDKVQKKQFLEAMKLNEKYQQTWLRGSDRIDIPYFIGKSFEQAGVFSEAGKIYEETMKRLKSIAGTHEDKERHVHERLPSPESLHLRLANVALNQRKYGEAYEQLKNTKNTANLSDEEKVEKVQIAASVAEAQGDLANAQKNLEELFKTWKGDTALVVPVELRLAELLNQSGKYEEALKYTDLIEKQKAQNQVSSDDIWAQALEAKGNALLGRGQDVAAVDAYQTLLEQFAGKRPLDTIRYKVGQILFKKGNIKAAEKIWAQLDGEKASVYKKLADEKLKNAAWQDEYKHYIKRIPAMSEVEKE